MASATTGPVCVSLVAYLIIRSIAQLVAFDYAYTFGYRATTDHGRRYRRLTCPARALCVVRRVTMHD